MTSNKICIYLLLSVFPIISKAQEEINSPSQPSKPELSTQERLDILSERYSRTHEIRGYRVQIVSSNKKDKAKKVMSKFAAKFPDYEVHEIYEQPFFIIKAGDFLTKLEAEKLQREVKLEFPGSFVVPDNITPYKQYVKEDS